MKNMKQPKKQNTEMIIIKPHSCLDIMTNSSSEVFICNGDKSLKMVESIIEKIMDDYNNPDRPHLDYWEPCGDTWGEVFKKPTICPFDITRENREEYESLGYDWFDHKRLQAKVEEMARLRPELSDSEARDAALENSKIESKKCFEAQKEYASKIGSQSDVRLFLNLGVIVAKGDIILGSAFDNSVPYDLWELINSMLSSTNWHLG